MKYLPRTTENPVCEDGEERELFSRKIFILIHTYRNVVRGLYVSFILIFHISSSIQADTIQTTSGELLEGTILQDNQEGVTLQTKYGKMDFSPSQIVKITYESQVPGDKYFQEKEYDKAIAEYQKAIDQNPQNKEIVIKLMYQIGLCQYELQKYLQAIETFQRLLTEYPEATIKDKALFQIAQSYVKQEDKTLALSKCQQLVQQYPQSLLAGDALYEIGLLYEEANNPDSALEAYQRLVNEYPKSAKLSLAKEHIDQIQFNQKAPELLTQAKVRFNEINQMKWDYKNLILYNEVIKICEEVVKKSTVTYVVLDAQKLIIDCYIQQAEYSKSNDAFNRYIERLKEYGEYKKLIQVLNETANNYFISKNYEKAKEFYEKLINDCSKDMMGDKYYVSIVFKLAMCNKNLCKYKDAISFYETIIKDYPRTKWAVKSCSQLVDCYIAVGELEKAINIYDGKGENKILPKRKDD